MNMVVDIRDQITLTTERLVLRPVRRSDMGLIGLYAGDIRVSAPTRSIPHPLPPGAVETFVESCQSPGRKEDVWVLDGSRHGLPEVVGLIGLERMDRGQAELGYWLGHGFWGQGFARESVAAILDANPQGSDTIFAEVFQDNPRSAKILTEQGFTYLGDAENWCVSRHKNIATWTYLKSM